ncbi:TPA: hypothetical protein ACOEDJ_004170 [Enterobacter asburiae]
MLTSLNNYIITANVIFIILYLVYLFERKAFKMNAEPLTHQPLFKAALIIPIVSFALLGSIVWQGHSFQIDDEGFNNFLTISKLPLAVLSLCIPFGVIVNNIHRTIQTDKQIKEAERKNIVDGFYSHRKHTVEVIQNLEFTSINILGEEYELQFRNSYSCYKVFFPFATESRLDFNASPSFTSTLERLWLGMASLIEKPHFNDLHHYYSHLCIMEKALFQIHLACLFKDFDNQKIFSIVFLDKNGESWELRTRFSSESSFKRSVSGYWHAYISIMELFEYQYSDEFKQKTRPMIDYILGFEKRYEKWSDGNEVKATQPQLLKL